MAPIRRNESVTETRTLIYCRVSDKKQETEGTGGASQEHRCREYAVAHGYTVEAVFHDVKSGHGDFMSRPGMVAVLRYLREHRRNQYVVIFDDLKRFARDTVFHLNLRSRLAEFGAIPECLNFKFEETPEGRFVETVIAAQGELERHQIRRQTLQKMKARVEQGFYVFRQPVGYRYMAMKGQGSLLFKDESVAPLVQEAMEGFASGRFQTQAEVKRFLEQHPEFPRDAKGEVRNQHVADILKRPVYAGMVEAPRWGVSLRKGHHEPLISFETYQRI